MAAVGSKTLLASLKRLIKTASTPTSIPMTVVAKISRQPPPKNLAEAPEASAKQIVLNIGP